MAASVTWQKTADNGSTRTGATHNKRSVLRINICKPEDH